MYRKIGEVAELLGITPSAIRKYEEKGILKSKRQTGNDYRQYDVHDIAKFIRARMYKNMGFSLSEAVDILNNTRIAQYPDIIEKQKEKLAQEILYRQKMLEIMSQWQREIAEVDAPIRIEYSPAVYFFKYFSDLRLITDKAQIKSARAALEHVPISYPGFVFERGSILQNKDVLGTVGVYVKESDIVSLGIRSGVGSEYYPSRMCITCTIQSAKEQRMSIHQVHGALAYLEGKGLRVTGDMLGKFILSDFESDDYRYYSKIWIPFD